MIKDYGDYKIQILNELPNEDLLFKLARCKWRGMPEMFNNGIEWWKNIFNIKQKLKNLLEIIILIAVETKTNDCVGHVIFYQHSDQSNQWLLSDLKTTGTFRNKGIATNMILTGIKAINEIEGIEIFAYIDDSNTPSINLHNKLGFKVQEKLIFDDFDINDNENVYKLDIKKVFSRLNNLTFKQLYNDNTKDVEIFTDLLLEYFHELDSYKSAKDQKSDDTIKEFARGMVNRQGDLDRYLELCYLEDQLIGFLYGKIDHVGHLGFIKPEYGYIMEFFVRKEFRRKGFGKMMFEHLQMLFKEHNAKKMYLTAAPVTGEPFWVSMGFKYLGEISPINNMKIFEKDII